ncbi:unnamed protein product [Clonostachys chloroleuca]|uniref:YTH domain-containing protein n=1 Tax=Clonostachys chloroleuca TaxID=1926264 RepID=A0AA35VFX9_9HYPO|nr:unnamed protein product [Clonostachys chloroleuca]
MEGSGSQPASTTEQASGSAPLSSPPLVQAHPPFRQDARPQQDMRSPPASHGRQGTYNMMPMMSTLPQVQRVEHHHHHHHPGQVPYHQSTSPHVMHPMVQIAHYGPGPTFNMPHQEFYSQQPQHPPVAQYYNNRQISPQAQPIQNMTYYPNQVVMGHPHHAYYYAQPNRYPAPNQGMLGAMVSGQYMAPVPPSTANDPRLMKTPSDGGRVPTQPTKQDLEASERRPSTTVVRGPPRKPRQSGHAIWIGNLPPQTDLMNLVNHVYSLIPGLESLFLISKSNCAFANFKDDATCVEAQQKLHDSKFQSVRLVSRLRKNVADSTSGSPALQGLPSPKPNSTVDGDESSSVISPSEPDPSPSASTSSLRKGSTTTDGGQQDRFFILKSLTVADLELSVKTGIWATQSHNEQSLNDAFKTADNVYLIFSANKSGEYFGYARMLSEMDEDPAAAIEFAPQTQATDDTDLPKEIPTEATEFAPRGQIIDDSARGTIFWQVDRLESEIGSDKESDAGSTKSNEEEEEESKTWGKPFKLDWLCTTRMPFYKARGLRNPWNSNREVKIARDGTEIEPVIGKRLIGLFNRHQRTGQFATAPRSPMSPGMEHGFPPIRPYWP